MSDMIVRDEQNGKEVFEHPPLYLQHYLDEREGHIFSEQASKPPGRTAARIAERRDNLIVLEFEEAVSHQFSRKWLRDYLRYLCRNGWDIAMLLFLLGTAVVCVMSLLR